MVFSSAFCLHRILQYLMESPCRRNISRRYSYPLRAGQKSAYLCTETTVYRYVDNLVAPKAWFVANIDSILDLYGKEHRLQKEDVLFG